MNVEEIKITLKNQWINFKSFTKECTRVLKVTKKPSMKEFKMIMKVSALGMVVIGLLGFIVSVLSAIIS